MAHILRFLHGRHGVENVLTYHTALSSTLIGVDREIAYAKGGKVLEEMSALAGIYTIVFNATSTITFAAEICGHFTGTPSHGSLEPHRPGPMST